MAANELTRLLPKNRDDVEGARALLARGYPTLEPILKSLFQWLETGGSAVELEMRQFFASLGEPALELVREALDASIKPARKHALLRYILPAWPRESVAKLEPQLMRLIQTYDFYGLDVWALTLMLSKGIGPVEELERWRELKISKLHEQLAALRD